MSRHIWSCKVGGEIEAIPESGDNEMRTAVGDQFRELTGTHPEFIFSGFGAHLTEPELAVVENREPTHAHEIEWGDWKATAEMMAEALRLTREYVGEDKLPALPGWSWFDAMQQYEKTKLAYA